MPFVALNHCSTYINIEREYMPTCCCSYFVLCTYVVVVCGTSSQTPAIEEQLLLVWCCFCFSSEFLLRQNAKVYYTRTFDADLCECDDDDVVNEFRIRRIARYDYILYINLAEPNKTIYGVYT